MLYNPINIFVSVGNSINDLDLINTTLYNLSISLPLPNKITIIKKFVVYPVFLSKLAF
jgi:hypothetical protein